MSTRKKGNINKVQGKVGNKAWNKKVMGRVAALVKSQTASLRKQQEAETADLNEISTVISSFAKDQGSKKHPEANGKSSDTAAVTAALNLNAIQKKLRSDP